MILQDGWDRQEAPFSCEQEDIPMPPDRQHKASPQAYRAEGGYLSSSQAGTRSIGMIMTVVLHALVAAALLINWGVSQASKEQMRLVVFDVAKPAAPPEPQTEIPPGPEQVEQEAVPEKDDPIIDLPTIRLTQESQIVLPEITPVPEPAQPVEQTTAPESAPAPPAPSVSGDAPDWQSRVLAALDRTKRYPRAAQRRRQQGMPWIRFTMDREGNVISVALEQSSGFDLLDDEAINLPKRAEPLPKPPGNVGGSVIELVVPVEFFIR